MTVRAAVRAEQRPGFRIPYAGIAWSLCLLTCILVLCTAVLTVQNGLTWRQVVVDESIATICLLAISFAAVGGLLASRRPRNPIGWIFGAAALTQVLVVACEQYAMFALVTSPGSLPAGDLASWLKEWVWAPGLGLIIVLLPLLFPTGRPPSHRWWVVAWVGGLAVAVISLLGGAMLWSHRGLALLAEDGQAEYSLAPAWALVVDWLAFPALVVASLAAMASLVVRFRRADDRERRQVLWLGAALALTLTFVIASQALPGSGTIDGVVAGLGLVIAPAIPVATGVSILRHRLFDLDVVLNRTFVWGGLGAALVGFYVVVVGFLGRLLRAEDSVVISLVTTGVVAVLFAPLRERLQRAVNRLVYGDRDDPYGVMLRLGERLESAQAPQAVLSAIAETVASALKLRYVAIEVVHGDDRRLAAEVGERSGDGYRVPLVYGGAAVGELVACPRAPDERFGAADRRLLTDLARQVGVAVHAVRLTEDLQRSRERLVVAREEERRRLRRDLHDGVGPALSSSIFKLAAARRQLPAGSDIDHVLVDVRDDLRATVADIRSMAHDLRPPALDQLGLLAAVEDHATSLDDAGLRVEIAAPASLAGLPAAVEVAAFLIAREALSNVARHSGARSAFVRMAVQNEASRPELTIQVNDDGSGIPEGHPPGVGLSSMRERAEELGGALTIKTSPSGTEVSARLPLGEIQ